MSLPMLKSEELQMPGDGSVDMHQAGGSFGSIGQGTDIPADIPALSAPSTGAIQEQENSIA